MRRPISPNSTDADQRPTGQPPRQSPATRQEDWPRASARPLDGVPRQSGRPVGARPTASGPRPATATVLPAPRSAPAFRPGLSAPVAALVLLTAGFAGGAIDAATGVGLRVAFAVLFISGAVAVARFVRPRDRRAAMVMPPLVYAAVTVVFGADVGSSGPTLTNRLMALLTTLITCAPTLLIAVGLMATILLGRAVTARMGRGAVLSR